MTNNELIETAKEVMDGLRNLDNGRMLPHEQSAYDCIAMLDREVKRLHSVICAAISAINDEDDKYMALRILAEEEDYPLG